MEILISRRHTEAHPSLQAYIERKVEALERVCDSVQSVSVILDEAGGRHHVEFSASIRRAAPLVAQAEGDSWHESVNLAAARIETQVRRLKERRAERRRRA